MTQNSYQVFNENETEVPFNTERLGEIIKLLEGHETCRFIMVEVVFVGKEEILRINREYLGHDYYTDIITFPYEEDASKIEATLYCCASQIKRQSTEHHVTFENEVLRVVIHGLLHLAGYDDRTERSRMSMHELENKYINRLYQDK